MQVKQSRKLVNAYDDQLSVAGQCRLLNLHRSVYYYKPKGISAEDLHIMHLVDRMYIEDPTRGSRRFRRDLALKGVRVSREKVRGLVGVMCLKTIYPWPRRTSSDAEFYKIP